MPQLLSLSSPEPKRLGQPKCKMPHDAMKLPRAATKTQGSQLNKVNFHNTELLKKKKKDNDDVKLLAITINLLVTQTVSRPAEFFEQCIFQLGISKMKIKTHPLNQINLALWKSHRIVLFLSFHHGPEKPSSKLGMSIS